MVVYVLYSKALNKFYVGYTYDLPRRIHEHNSGKGNFTSQGKPWELVVEFECNKRSDAIRLELKIKRRGIRRYLQDLGLKNFGM
jgi:putative endonuclease